MENVTVASNSTFGRYLIASKDLQIGDKILSEKPLIVGPSINGLPICFQCSNQIECYHCECIGCNWAIFCSKKCQGKFNKEDCSQWGKKSVSGHCKFECKLLQDKKLKKDLVLKEPQVVLPVRVLLMREYKKKLWKKFIKLESHLEKRRNTAIWNFYEEKVSKILKEVNFLSEEDINTEIMQKICGILDVNCFELRSSGKNYFQSTNIFNRGIYLKAALMAHDCVGNTHLATDDHFLLTIRASQKIAKGDAIFFNYSNPSNGTYDRRMHLSEGKYFDCTCKRCSDPSELGTEISSILCPKCKSAVRPSTPLDNVYKNYWGCNNCPHKYNGPLMKLTIEECKKLIDSTEDSIGSMENTLKELLLTLHKQHYFILDLKQKLIGLYTQVKPTQEILERKIELCRDLIPVYEIIEPGISRMLGLIYYELYSASNHPEAEPILSRARKMLMYEPVESPEGRLFLAMKKITSTTE